MLSLKIQKQWPNFELDLDLEIKPAFTALFGPSGSGKTTTLNLVAGLARPDQGEISLQDQVLYSSQKRVNTSPQNRSVGYIFQESRLFPHYSVQENLEFGLTKVPEGEHRFDFSKIVEIAGIRALLNRMPADLSGGEKQRVALARALLASPDTLLMDEPLAALDLSARLSFLTFLKEIHLKFKLPILYVTHDLASVLNFADEVVILQNGKNIGYGRPYELLDKMTVAPLVSSAEIANILELEVTTDKSSNGLTEATSDHLSFVVPHLDCTVGEKLTLNIPASEIIIGIKEPDGLSATNILPGKITDIHQLGERILVDVKAGPKFTVEIVPATVERLGLRSGKAVFLIFKASSFRRLA